MSAPVAPTPTDHEVPAPRRLKGPVRVNLLPESTRQRDRAARQRNGLLGAGVLLLALLGLIYWWASAQVTAAETQLAAELAVTSELRAEVDAMAGFQEMIQRREMASSALTEALAGEVSFAGVLQDLAVVMPSDAQLDSLALTFEPAAAGATEAAAAVGIFTATGQTLTSHAPGVERLILELGKVASLLDPHLNSSTLNDPEEQVSTFSLEGRIGAEAATGRYHEGLPEELR
jgi:Tfp pilus assembly protein PilN